MGIGREMRDPWGVLLGAVAGGLAWATGVAPVAALGIGAAVLGVKVVTGAFGNRAPRETSGLLPVSKDSVEHSWLRRAQRAVATFEDVARSVGAGPVSERVRGFTVELDDTLASVRRLAGQASAVGTALMRLNVAWLQRERTRLAAGVQDAPPRVRTERQRSLDAVQGQLDAHQRLAEAREALLARIESAAIELEGLVARLSEVVALAATASSSVDGTSRVDDLAAQLDGLRAGLVEAEDVSSRALGALDVPSSGTVPPRGRGTAR